MTTTQEDELLILDDTTSSDTLVLDDATLDLTEKSTNSDDLITFGEEVSTDTETAKLELDEISEPLISEESDLNFDISEESPKSNEENTLEIDTDLDTDLSISNDDLEESSIIEEPVSQIETFSLESATALYISQLEKAKETNNSNIIEDETNISNREEDISKLKSEITDYKKAIKNLESENKEIDHKISLVTGNNSTEIKTTTSKRVHNVRRKKAA